MSAKALDRIGHPMESLTHFGSSETIALLCHLAVIAALVVSVDSLPNTPLEGRATLVHAAA